VFVPGDFTMFAMLEAESTLTDRYQTTVPKNIRRALRLGKRARIRYTISPVGEVMLTRAEATEDADPVLEKFLSFLAQDIAAHPKRLLNLDAGLARRIRKLVTGVEVDLDAPLSASAE
jgi:antitoxin PrlF